MCRSRDNALHSQLLTLLVWSKFSSAYSEVRQSNFVKMFSLLAKRIIIADGMRFSRSFSSKYKFQKSFKTSIGAQGPLINGPDYTFLDGRKTPLGSSKRRRADEQLEVTSQVLQLLGEVNFAIDHHKKSQEEVKEKRQAKLNSKLKPKASKKLT
ncbi:large ribosomal subunit protein mL52 isoform X1 [Palaemon carinicauda]|uniref:large ribosomal subunit protein mL52 isoform X1 n=1 Tax=Palaemon carinicauda TaxID=392227 RepID=UPI0035B5BAD7